MSQDASATDPANLPIEVKQSIYRIMVAIRNHIISVRNASGGIFVEEEDFIDFWMAYPHHRKFTACLKGGKFNKEYLDSLYVWRPDVLRWCAKDQLPIPPVWQPKPGIEAESENDTDDTHWHDSLSDRRKQITTVLHIASHLWEDNPKLSYEEVWTHPDMLKYDKPRIFPSLDSFKKWARNIAPTEAKSPGKRRKSL